MNREPRVFANGDELGSLVAQEIVQGMEDSFSSGRNYILGAPSGRTPRSTYRALARLLGRRRDLDLSRLIVVMMDDYVVQDSVTGNFQAVDVALPYSCEGFGRREIVGGINDERDGTGMSIANIWSPHVNDPASYDRRIKAAGGIDYFILATGKSDGHVAFNPPGTALNSRTRIVDLSVETRNDNLGTFPDFRSLGEVPTHGITVGLETIRESRRAVMLVTGKEKRNALSQLTKVDQYNPRWPSTIVHECRDHDIYVTEDALGES